jgi:3-oxoacyl-[acyl-carrier protein] reductase
MESAQRRVLVTGSGRGIGSAIAKRISLDGFPVTVHCRSRVEDAKAVCDEIAAHGGEADLLVFDVTDRATVREVLEQQVLEKGPYYGIVCNAGVTRDNPFPGLSEEDWDIVIRTGLDSFYNIVHPLIMPMIQMRKGGRIITLSSVSGVFGNRGQVNYSAAKAGIIGATKALAAELGSRRITVNCIAPGLIETEMLQGVDLKEALAPVPMNRIGQPEDVAALAAFLMSDDAGYISRQVIGVNGGLI